MAQFNNINLSDHKFKAGNMTYNDNRVYNEANALSYFDTNSYRLVGLNTAEIPNMKSAIQNYVDKINERMNEISSYLDAATAFKGSGMEIEVKGYVDSVFRYIQRSIIELSKFSDRLSIVEREWLAATQKMASAVSAGTSEVDQTKTELSSYE